VLFENPKAAERLNHLGVEVFGAHDVSKAARRFRAAQLPASHARLLPRRTAPAWCFVNLPMTDASSSRIRAAGGWPRG